MEQGSEQNKTEEATPYKLKRARERGMLARGMDLGFFSGLSGLALYYAAAGEKAFTGFEALIRRMFESLPALSAGPQEARIVLASVYWPTFQFFAAMGATIALVVIIFEIVQLRGLVFTAKPLKPDFSRLNPAKGLKRVFSMRMLKETLKSLVKLVAYFACAYLVVSFAFDTYAHSMNSASRVAEALQTTAVRLLFTFILVALFIAIIDQVLSRQDFAKQMRMSRSELTREHKEREGEPRMKQKRKQLHAEFASQTRSAQGLGGADLVIVNPEHFAVALAYDGARMEAPRVKAKGRNAFALQMKRRAFQLGIPIFERPQLARALYRSSANGAEVAPQLYREVADLYLHLYRERGKHQ